MLVIAPGVVLGIGHAPLATAEIWRFGFVECRGPAGELHVVHAFDVTPALATPMDPMATPPPIREITDSMRARHTEAVHELTDAHGIPRDCVHVHAGSTRAVVVELTEKLRADVVVMGGISRRGLKRLFLGNTAEETLDELSCDLLIVKPAGFETSVPR